MEFRLAPPPQGILVNVRAKNRHWAAARWGGGGGGGGAIANLTMTCPVLGRSLLRREILGCASQ